MILVDTSIWIRFVLNRLHHAQELEVLLFEQQVAGHELVYGELLIGDRGGRMKLLSDYELLPYAPLVPHSEVVHFTRSRNLHGRGAGWIDINLLASAMVAGFEFWTADPPLAAIATELGIAYKEAS